MPSVGDMPANVDVSQFFIGEGYLDLPTGPGLGIELDEDALASQVGHDWRNQESYDKDDGSVVDW